jgi:cold shock CspA family protein
MVWAQWCGSPPVGHNRHTNEGEKSPGQGHSEESRVMRRGTVTYWDEQRRIGFIRPDDGGADVSYRPAGGAPDVQVGDRVEFEVLPRM